jgi:GTP cyclohydrolase I
VSAVQRNVYPILPAPVDPGAGEFPVERVAAAFRGFLESLGLDLANPNLAGTDLRVARAYQEMLSGLRRGEPELSEFPNTKRSAGMITVTDIPFYSICAHHFLPFFGTAHIGYVPLDRLVGLSKLTRVVDFYARRPQLQEDLTEEVAALLDERLAPAGLIVFLEGRHLCMEMRGVSKPGVTTRTTAVRGTLQDESLQREFFARVRGAGAPAIPGGGVRP